MYLKRLSLSLIFAATVAPIAVAATTPAPLPPRIEQAIPARIASGEYPAMVVAVVDGDRSHVYGFGKLSNGKPPGADTVFQIGSITKTFTATLLAQAIEKGDVTLDTPVAKLLPAFKVPSRNGKQITLGEIASQFSGLPRLPSNLDLTNLQDPYVDYDASKLASFLAGYTLPRDPGESYEYSNLGFGLLGYALAQHAGKPYAELLQSQILAPLDMSSSSTTFTLPLDPRWAIGQDQEGKPAQPWHLGVLAGAGAINSTGADMLRYLQANMGRGHYPLQSAMRLAHKPLRPLGAEGNIGLAWMTRHDKAGDVIWHNGMTGGYASFIGFTADGERGVVILTNVAQSVDDLGFATLLADAPLAPAEKAIAMSPQQLDKYIGDYQLAPGFVLSVFRSEDQLKAKATGQGAISIFPSATGAFFARVAGIRIDFQRDKNDNVVSLVLHQNGRDTTAKKLDASAIGKASGRPTVNLDASTLKSYIGRYQLAPSAVFDITFESGQLKAQLSGQPAFPIYSSAKDEFFYTVVDAQLSFQRDAQGKVEAVVLHQNGKDRRAPRVP